jgi:hypothetical protein
MLVNIRGTIVELPIPEAQQLLRLGYAQELETATMEMGDRFSSTPMRRGQQQATGSKQRNSAQGSKKQGTMLPSTPTTD